MKPSKEVKAGIVVVVAIGLFIYGFNFLKGINVFSNQRAYYAVYSHVDGLTEANPVLVNGYKVGQVYSLEIMPGSRSKLLVKFLIDNPDIKVTKGSVAKIISSDLLGSKAVDLQINHLSRRLAEDGDTLTAAVDLSLSDAVNQQVKPLKDKAENLISSIDSVMLVVQAVLNKDVREDLTSSFGGIKRAILSLEHTSIELDKLVSEERKTLAKIFLNVESITNNLKENNDVLAKALNNVALITDSIAKSSLKSTINSANTALKGVSDVMDKINRGEGTLGLLINDPKLYKKLNSASGAVEHLVRDIEKYPGVYFPLKGKSDQRKKTRDLKAGK